MENLNGNKKMVKYSPNCGAKLDEQVGPSRYCHNCGSKLEEDTEKSKEI